MICHILQCMYGKNCSTCDVLIVPGSIDINECATVGLHFHSSYCCECRLRGRTFQGSCAPCEKRFRLRKRLRNSKGMDEVSKNKLIESTERFPFSFSQLEMKKYEQREKIKTIGREKFRKLMGESDDLFHRQKLDDALTIVREAQNVAFSMDSMSMKTEANNLLEKIVKGVEYKKDLKEYALELVSEIAKLNINEIVEKEMIRVERKCSDIVDRKLATVQSPVTRDVLEITESIEMNGVARAVMKLFNDIVDIADVYTTLSGKPIGGQPDNLLNISKVSISTQCDWNTIEKNSKMIRDISKYWHDELLEITNENTVEVDGSKKNTLDDIFVNLKWAELDIYDFNAHVNFPTTSQLHPQKYIFHSNISKDFLIGKILTSVWGSIAHVETIKTGLRNSANVVENSNTNGIVGNEKVTRDIWEIIGTVRVSNIAHALVHLHNGIVDIAETFDRVSIKKKQELSGVQNIMKGSTGNPSNDFWGVTKVSVETHDSWETVKDLSAKIHEMSAYLHDDLLKITNKNTVNIIGPKTNLFHDILVNSRWTELDLHDAYYIVKYEEMSHLHPQNYVFDSNLREDLAIEQILLSVLQSISHISMLNENIQTWKNK